MIVVGGGPSGSQVAYKLAAMGYIVAVVEKKASLNGVVCCTGLVSRECVEKYSIPEGVIHRWVNGASLFLQPVNRFMSSEILPRWQF